MKRPFTREKVPYNHLMENPKTSVSRRTTLYLTRLSRNTFLCALVVAINYSSNKDDLLLCFLSRPRNGARPTLIWLAISERSSTPSNKSQ